ncbi:MAG: hemolysin family protein [Planctomycetota bacterium]
MSRTLRRNTLNTTVLLAVLKASADLTDAELPPSAAEVAAPTDFLLLLPILLILIGAILGGLRTLLQSPVRPMLLDGLDDTIEERIERTLEQHPSLPSAAGLARLFLLAAASVLLLNGIANLESISRWGIGLISALFGGLMLEAFPALVQRRRARRFVLSLLPLAVAFTFLLRPLTLVFERLLALMGAEQNDTSTTDLSTKLLDVAAEHLRAKELSETEQHMIGRVLDLPEADAASTMTPRTALTAVAQDCNLADFLKLALEEGHSRIPVYEQNLDDIKGVIYLKDLMQLTVEGRDLKQEKVSQHMREPYFVPETKSVPNLLEEMRQRRIHLAVVVDEYGGTAGVVTIEDLIEEIVGEIKDEHDDKEESAELVRVDENKVEADGRVAIYDLNEFFGSDLPEDEDYDTIAGLLFDRFGHIPVVGESLKLDGLFIEVLQADDRRIHRVRLTRIQPDEQQAEVA